MEKKKAKAGFPGGSDGKESICKAEGPDLITGLGRTPREWNGCSFQYSYLENVMHRGAWKAIVHRMEKCWKWLND